MILEIRALLKAAEEVQFQAPNPQGRYAWIEGVLGHHRSWSG